MPLDNEGKSDTVVDTIPANVCRACPKKGPISEEKHISRCVKCKSIYHNSCARRIFKSGLCQICQKSSDDAPLPTMSSKSSTGSSGDLEKSIRGMIAELKTELGGKIDNSEASVKKEIAKIGKDVSKLRQDHDALQSKHNVLKAAHEKLASEHGELQDDHNHVKDLVVQQQKQDLSALCIRELSEREAKRKSSIIFGVAEDGESTKNQSNASSDVQTVKTILETLSPDLAKLKFTTYRIGKAVQHTASNPRPLKVSLPTASDGDLLRILFVKQKRGSQMLPMFVNLNIVKDRTKRQLEDYRTKKETLAQRQRNGESGLVVKEKFGEFVIVKKQDNFPAPSYSSTPTNAEETIQNSTKVQ